MITVLHLADLHIGIENYGHIDATSGLHTRLLDYLERFDEAIDIGLQHKVDLVLIAGDIYKNRQPNPTHQREFARRIERLRQANVPVLILTGNHDIAASLGRAHSVDIFNTLARDGVIIADKPHLHRIETPSGVVQVVTLPWVTHHGLLTREDMRMASLSDIDRMIIQRIEAFIDEKARELDPTLPAILTLHAMIDGAKNGAEQSLTLGKDRVLPRSIVANRAFDYVAAGHIHRHQVLGEHPPVVYAGSIERVDFGERNEAKGCVMVQLERGNTQWQFHPLAARPFISIDVDVRSSSTPYEHMLMAIERHHVANAVVRVEIDANADQKSLLREDALRQAIRDAGANYVASVNIHVQHERRSRFVDADGDDVLDGLTPRRALERYIQARQVPDEQRTSLLHAFDELMTSVDNE